jgi:hypothetical protein
VILVDFSTVHTMADFEVIDIVKYTSQYPTLLGLDWAFDDQDIINFKTRKMIFDSREYRVIAPLDPSEGGKYVEPATDNILTEDVNQLYKTIMREEDYINQLQMECSIGGVLVPVLQTLTQDWRNGSNNYMNYLPRDVPK